MSDNLKKAKPIRIDASGIGDGRVLMSLNDETVFSNQIKGGLYISGHLLPQESGIYDLGSLSHPWKTLYLEGNTLYLGKNAISSEGIGAISIPATISKVS